MKLFNGESALSLKTIYSILFFHYFQEHHLVKTPHLPDEIICTNYKVKLLKYCNTNLIMQELRKSYRSTGLAHETPITMCCSQRLEYFFNSIVSIAALNVYFLHVSKFMPSLASILKHQWVLVCAV